MGRKMKEEGKWCETSVIIIMIEKKKSAKLHFQLRHTDLFVED